MDKIMTVREVAEYLRLNQVTVYKHAAKGNIPSMRIGRGWRFHKDVIDRWIKGIQKERHTN